MGGHCGGSVSIIDNSNFLLHPAILDNIVFIDMDMKMIYQDHLVSITEDTIGFEHYYFPTGKKKVVRFADIEWIQVKKSTLLNGKWRIHGTGNFKTWFPRDRKRLWRDKLFFAKLRGRWVDIGFTVEDAGRVESIFRKKNLIIPE